MEVLGYETVKQLLSGIDAAAEVLHLDRPAVDSIHQIVSIGILLFSVLLPFRLIWKFDVRHVTQICAEKIWKALRSFHRSSWDPIRPSEFALRRSATTQIAIWGTLCLTNLFMALYTSLFVFLCADMLFIEIFEKTMHIRYGFVGHVFVISFGMLCGFSASAYIGMGWNALKNAVFVWKTSKSQLRLF